MSLILKQEVTDEQLLNTGFIKGPQYWNLGQSTGCVSINRKTREVCVKYQSSGYKSIGNQCLPNVLLELFQRNWISSD